MKAFSFFAALSAIAYFLSSCVYSDEGEYFGVPVSGEPPALSVECNLDTIAYVTTSDEVLVSYTAVIENGIIYLASAEVNEQLTYDTIANLEATMETGPQVLRDSFLIKKVL